VEVTREAGLAGDRRGRPGKRQVTILSREAWQDAWHLDGSMALYGPDGFHPSEAGSYLAALVIFQQLAGVDPRGLPPGAGDTDLPSRVVGVLQEAAASANADFARP
jgi:hypothetical protein